MSDPLIGTTIGGCEILEVLGHGGMGIIYKARQKSLDRVVALKVLAPKFADDFNFVARFQREARAIARVNHQNILAVYDVGSEDNIHYMIMELIDGESLAETQDGVAGPLKMEDASNFVTQAAQGLEAAQAAGVTHRDIKPENLMVTKKGIVKVSDFGLAKDADSGATSTDAVMGTPAFMSPEQCDGKKVDGRTDIYSLGATFYKLATGRLPFEAETAMSMMYRHKHEALVPPKEVTPSIPTAISDMIIKMMAKKRENRFQNMTEVLEALQNANQESAPGPSQSARQPAEKELEIRLPEPPAAAGRPASERRAPAGKVGALPPLPGAGGASSRRYSDPAPPPGVGVSGIRSRPGSRRPSERLAPPSLGGTPRVGSSARSADHMMGGPTSDGQALVVRGDQLLAQGDRLAGLKCFREALKAGGLNDESTKRIQEEIDSEIQTRQQSGESLLGRGLMVEASREFRLLLDIDPKNEDIRTVLKDLEKKLADRRTLVNDIRTAIAGLQFEEALRLWDNTPPDLRDEGLGKQIEHIRKVIGPSLKLCDKADQYSEQGRVEEALATYKDALRIDENCERARQGLRDADVKMSRIGAMLKEGYELNLKQDYEKAIEVWKPILKLRPGHPQATKSIVDSYVAMGQELKTQGDLSGALDAFSAAIEVDPQNMTLKRQVEEIIELHDKEQALIDRAKDAVSKNRKGEAIRYWQEILRLNPASKLAPAAVKELKSARTKSSVALIVAVIAALTAIGFGYQFASEYIAFSRIEGLVKQSEEQQALEEMEDVSWWFYKAEAARLKVRAEVSFRIELADGLIKLGQVDPAVDVLKKAAELTDNPREAENLLLQCVQIQAQAKYDEGENAIKEKEWTSARVCYEEVKELAKGQANDSLLDGLEDMAHNALLFISEVEAGLEAFKRKNRGDSLRHFKKAIELRPDDPFASQFLEKDLKHSEEQYIKHLARAERALNEPWRDGVLKEADEALKKAADADPGQARIKVLRSFLSDMRKCVARGMVLATFVQPHEVRLTWRGTIERKKAFCIDRYEYPNKGGVPPRSSVSYIEADKACRDQNKRLCTVAQWQKACRMKQYRAGVYTFGPTLDESACNWGGKSKKAPSGSFARCRNGIGAYDMNGNLAEWTEDSEGQAFLAGGSFATDPQNARCSDRVLPKKGVEKSNEMGFRCCSLLDVE